MDDRFDSNQNSYANNRDDFLNQNPYAQQPLDNGGQYQPQQYQAPQPNQPQQYQTPQPNQPQQYQTPQPNQPQQYQAPQPYQTQQPYQSQPNQPTQYQQQYPNPYAQYQYNQQQNAAYNGQNYATVSNEEDPGKSLGIASLILGIASLFCCGILTAIPGVITGLLGIKKSKKQNGMAIAGLIISGVCLLLGIVAIIYLCVVIANHPDIIETYY